MSKRVNYLTVAQNFALEAACTVLCDSGWQPYLVGSVMERRDFRDVDLRCIMDDDEFDAMFKGARVRLRLMNAAISDWMSARTGLPIDFQFMSMRENTERFADRPRNPMGILLESERAQDRREKIDAE